MNPGRVWNFRQIQGVSQWFLEISGLQGERGSCKATVCDYQRHSNSLRCVGSRISARASPQRGSEHTHIPLRTGQPHHKSSPYFVVFFFRRTRVGIRAPNKVLARDDESDRVEKGPMMMMMLCCNFHVYVRLIVHSRNIMMGNYLEIIIAVSDDDYAFPLCWCAVGGGKPTE